MTTDNGGSDDLFEEISFKRNRLQTFECELYVDQILGTDRTFPRTRLLLIRPDLLPSK